MSDHYAEAGKMELSALIGSSRRVQDEKRGHFGDVNKMVGCDVKTKWIVSLQHRIKGKWVDPLPGMDRLHATCATRADARALVKEYLPPRPGQRFVIRKEVVK